MDKNITIYNQELSMRNRPLIHIIGGLVALFLIGTFELFIIPSVSPNPQPYNQALVGSTPAPSNSVADDGQWRWINDGTTCGGRNDFPGSCNSGKHEVSYVQVGRKFYLLGGREDNSDVQIYDPVTKIWTRGAKPPTEFLHHFQALEYDGLIYVLGAFGDNNFPSEDPVDRIYIYNPATDEWIDGPKIPANRRRGGGGAVIYKNKFYVVCGNRNGHSKFMPNGTTLALSTWFDEFDPATNEWRTLPDAPHARDHFHAAVKGNKMYVVAGRRSSGGPGQRNIDVFNDTEGAVDVFNFDTETWTTLDNDIPTERAGNAVAVLGDEVIVIGGEYTGGAYKTVEALDTKTGTWRTLEPMLQARHGVQAIVNNNAIYVASGSQNRGGGRTRTQEVFYFGGGGRPALQLNDLNPSRLAGPGDFDFGTVGVGSPQTRTIELSNENGNQAILITDIDLDGSPRFALGALPEFPLHIRPGAKFSIEVTFTPNADGERDAELIVEHTGRNDEIEIDLRAIGSTTFGRWAFINDGQTCAEIGTPGSCPEPRTGGDFIQIGSKFYLIGAKQEGIGVNIYDPLSSTWTVGAEPPIKLHSFQAVVYEGLIYVVGALTGDFPDETPVDRIYIYNPSSDRWIAGPFIPNTRLRGAAGAVVHNNKIYLVAGNRNGQNAFMPDGTTSAHAVWLDEFDPATNQWRTLSDAPRARDHFQAVVIDDKMYLAAGRKSSLGDAPGALNPRVRNIDVYDFATDTWATLGVEVPTPRSNNAAVVLDGRLVIVGGESTQNGGTPHRETEALNVDTEEWETLAPLQVARHSTGALVNNRSIYMAGGSETVGNNANPTITQSLEQFFLGNRAPNPTLIPITSGVLNLSATDLNFNLSEIGSPISQTLRLENTNGDQGIIIGEINIAGAPADYQINSPFGLPIHISPGATLDLEIVFNPQSVGDKGSNAALDYSADTEEIALTFTGVAVDKVSRNTQNTRKLLAGTQKRRVLRVTIDNGAQAANRDLTFNFSTLGTSNPGIITQAQLFYTGASNGFGTNIPVGNPVLNPDGDFTIAVDDQDLLADNNFFWLTFDIADEAILDDIIDAALNSVAVDGQTFNPDVVSPNGNRQVTILDNNAGTAFLAAGASEYLGIRNGVTLPETFTMEAWVNPRQDLSNNAWVIGEENGAQIIQNGRSFEFYIYDGAALIGPARITFSELNTWYHLAASFDGTQLRLYLNGFSDAPENIFAFDGINADRETAFSIASRANTTQKNELAIDEIRLWQGARTIQEIRRNINLVLDGKETNLLAYWQMNQSAGLGKDGFEDLVGDNTFNNRSANVNLEAADEPIGSGVAFSSVSQANTAIPFPGTNARLTFGETHPDAEIVITQLTDKSPFGIDPAPASEQFGSYWIIRNYGQNSGLSPLTLTLEGVNDFITFERPEGYIIYRRASNSNGGWDTGLSASSIDLENGRIEFSGLRGFSQVLLTKDPNALPIRLASFEGRRVNDLEVELNWVTVFERDNLGFEIQKSLDGSQFEPIAFVDGAGNSTGERNYQYLDRDARQAAFYRLKQIDFDGTSTLSETIFMDEDTNKIFLKINNPVGRELKIFASRSLEIEENIQMRLVNTVGKVIFARRGTLSHLQTDLNQYLNAVPGGLYVLEFRTNRQTFVTKFLRVR